MFKPRNWNKPNRMKRNTVEAKSKHAQKRWQKWQEKTEKKREANPGGWPIRPPPSASRENKPKPQLGAVLDESNVVFSLKEQTEAGWERVNVGIDSCAATSCIPESNAASWPLLKTAGATSYTTASGESVEVLGARRPLAWFQDHSQHLVNVKVLPALHKALFAVSDLVKSSKVVFDNEDNGGSYMENRSTKSRIRIYLRNGVYVMPVWFKVNPPTKMLAAQWEEIDWTHPPAPVCSTPGYYPSPKCSCNPHHHHNHAVHEPLPPQARVDPFVGQPLGA